MVLAVGTFITMIPRFEAAAISTLSTPTPARMSALSFLAAFKNLSSTSVELRVIATSTSPSIVRSSSFGTLAASMHSISSASRSSLTPSSKIASQTITFFFIAFPFLKMLNLPLNLVILSLLKKGEKSQALRYFASPSMTKIHSFFKFLQLFHGIFKIKFTAKLP